MLLSLSFDFKFTNISQEPVQNNLNIFPASSSLPDIISSLLSRRAPEQFKYQISKTILTATNASEQTGMLIRAVSCYDMLSACALVLRILVQFISNNQ